jgi:hypothetical protein
MKPMPECPRGGVDHSCLFDPMELRKELRNRRSWHIFAIGHQDRFDFAVMMFTVVVVLITVIACFFNHDLDRLSMTVILVINGVCLDYT